MQVGGFFAGSGDNEKIKGLYGNYNFWSWYRYWHVDTVNETTLMLIDKPYYDYDYEYFEPRKRRRVMSEDERKKALKGFGLNIRLRGCDDKDASPDDDIARAESLQREAMRALEDSRAR